MGFHAGTVQTIMSAVPIPPQPDPEAALVALAKQGDADAFTTLVNRYSGKIFRLAQHITQNQEDAEDVLQDAFLKVFLSIEQYRSDLSFDVWFTRILVNATLDRLKSRARHRRWISQSSGDEAGLPLEQVAGDEVSHERRLLARERWQQVTQAVAGLPDRQRLVFTLRHLDERTPAEISEATGMCQATVRVHLFRALRKLRGVMGEPA